MSIIMMYLNSLFLGFVVFFFFFKQKTAYEMRISDWSSDVCSSDLAAWALLEGWALSMKSFRPAPGMLPRSEERRVGKECVIRVDLGGRRIIKKKNKVER